MRAKEFINDNQTQVNELAPVLAAGLGALARGAATVGSKVVQGAMQGAAQLGKQAVGAAVTGAANKIAGAIKPGTAPATTSTNQTTVPTSPTELVKMKGKSIPTDLGQLKIGNTNAQGLEVNLDPNSKLGGLLGPKLTLPLRQ